ncbi:MAG: 50S ribosomal protein L29 [Candidatus Spechtbacterales bacterium]
MDAKELRQKSDQELSSMLNEKKARSVELSFSVVGGNVKNVREIRSLKKDIARITTILNERVEA